jgi:hypothetical protein
VLVAVDREMAAVEVDHRDARTHEPREGEHRHAGAKREGGVGVAQVVEVAQRLDPGRFLNGLPVPTVEVAEVEVAAARVREEQQVVLPRPEGVTAAIGEALGSAGVNVDGGFGSGKLGEIHVLVDDAAAARPAIEGAGFTVGGEQEAFVVEAANTPGELGRHARKLADAGVNIVSHYVASNNRLVFVPDDVEKARAALG